MPFPGDCISQARNGRDMKETAFKPNLEPRELNHEAQLVLFFVHLLLLPEVRA
jgi:hypothetical protein